MHKQELLNLNPQPRTLSNDNRPGAITLSADASDAETYIDPAQLIVKAITGNVRLTPTDTITVAIANPGVHKLSLATAAEAHTCTHISSPDLIATIPADNDLRPSFARQPWLALCYDEEDNEARKQCCGLNLSI